LPVDKIIVVCGCIWAVAIFFIYLFFFFTKRSLQHMGKKQQL